MRWYTYAALLCASAVCGLTKEDADGDWLTVRIAQGTVRGLKDPAYDLFAFHNIPYATAPKGKDKFKAPLPPPKWLQPLDAIDQGVVCPQADVGSMPPNVKKQEDCLIANVYVPNTEEKGLSVLVYVHGGAFQIGFGDMLKMKNLVKSKKVIVVTFNYRVGIHGFLCLGTSRAPGNAGMKDQVALLRWVNKNIANFGGNPKDVTIAGYSAGSASVDLLMLSKSTEGLYSKVIPESGSNLAAFSIQSDPLENAKSHAKNLNFTDVEDIYALEEFYTTASYDVLTLDAFIDRPDSTFLFSPCVERKIGEEVFLDDSPLNILKKGNYKKVPLLYGFANMEGLLRIDFFELWKHKMNEKFSDFLPADLIFENDDQKEQVALQVKEFYFSDKPVDDSGILGYVNFFSDVLFTYSTLRAVKLHAEVGHNQVYLYEYSFVDNSTPLVPHTNIRGATHTAQTMAIGDGNTVTSPSEDDASEELRNMKKIMREIWLNFTLTGKPIPEGSSLPAWPAAGADRSPHMSLDEKIELRGVLLEERTKFWDGIYERYYRQPVPPPQHMDVGQTTHRAVKTV